MTALIIFVVFVGVVIVMWIGARDVRAGMISPGYLVQFIIYSAFVAGAVATLSEVFGELQMASGAAERITEILDSEDPIRELTATEKLGRNNQVLINFKQINFCYPTRPNELVLNDLTFSLKKGETLAIVGPSGAGKSSIFQLLLRFYEYAKGAIEINNKPIRELKIEDLRNQFALVPQEPAIFANSVMENIRFGRPNASDEEVMEATRKAAAHDFVIDLPKGYETFVGEKGVLLSVGQKQRISIARAFLRNAPILLLDEATASLDAESENAIQGALEELSQSRSVIVVAHRLATVKRANRILVLDKGRIVSSGTHKELLSEGGLYSRLAKLQFLNT